MICIFRIPKTLLLFSLWGLKQVLAEQEGLRLQWESDFTAVSYVQMAYPPPGATQGLKHCCNATCQRFSQIAEKLSLVVYVVSQSRPTGSKTSNHSAFNVLSLSKSAKCFDEKISLGFPFHCSLHPRDEDRRWVCWEMAKSLLLEKYLHHLWLATLVRSNR